MNLHLAVGSLRPDGYHDVTTVFQALEFGDTITILDASAFSFSCSADVGVPREANLAYRAAVAMAERFDRALDVSIAVEKRIPAGAGLAGASTDAAAVIEGLAVRWGLDSADPAVLDVARTLGADVPFFFEGGAALFSGRGDVFDRRLRPLDAWIVLVKPAEPVSTAAAYAAFDAMPPGSSPSVEPLCELLDAGDAPGVARLLFNNMTDASTGLVPAVGVALDLVNAADGVMGAAVAGSGSAVFGICVDLPAAQRVAAVARRFGLWSEVTSASERGCVLEPL
jgi:4-diphosphocytidyl-2-C-methyl-D-erythritol kinase